MGFLTFSARSPATKTQEQCVSWQATAAPPSACATASAIAAGTASCMAGS